MHGYQLCKINCLSLYHPGQAMRGAGALYWCSCLIICFYSGLPHLWPLCIASNLPNATTAPCAALGPQSASLQSSRVQYCTSGRSTAHLPCPPVSPGVEGPAWDTEDHGSFLCMHLDVVQQ